MLLVPPAAGAALCCYGANHAFVRAHAHVQGESGDPATECGAWRESDGSKCTWHADVSFCTALNAQVPCEVFYADPDQGENCPSYCTWNKYAYKCVGANDVLRCDEYFTEDACAIEGCTWHDDLYKCWEKGENVACIEVSDAGEALVRRTCCICCGQRALCHAPSLGDQ